MKKIFAVIAALLVMGTANVFAKTGVGLQAGTSIVGGGFGGAVTLKLESLPCVLGVRIASFSPLAVGVTGDWWIANKNLGGPVNYYYGVGGAVGLVAGNDVFAFSVAGRAFTGLNAFFIDGFLEPFIQIAWQPGITIANGINPTLLDFPVDLGFRFWF